MIVPPPIYKEERIVLMMALYVLARLDSPNPRKTRVLRFIRRRGFVDLNEGDFELRSNGEEKWMNDFSWARENLKEEGFLEMPEFGIWKLTDSGCRWLLAKARLWTQGYEQDPDTVLEYINRSHQLNETFLSHILILGRGGDLRKKPNVAETLKHAPIEPFDIGSAA